MYVLPASFSLSYTSTTSTRVDKLPPPYLCLIHPHLRLFCHLFVLFSTLLLLPSAFVIFNMIYDVRNNYNDAVPCFLSFVWRMPLPLAELQVRHSLSKWITAYCIWLRYLHHALFIKHTQFHFLLLVLWLDDSIRFYDMRTPEKQLYWCDFLLQMM